MSPSPETPDRTPDPDSDGTKPSLLDSKTPETGSEEPLWPAYLFGVLVLGPLVYIAVGQYKLRDGYNDTMIALPLAFLVAVITTGIVNVTAPPERIVPHKAMIAGASPWFVSLAALQSYILAFGKYEVASWP